MTLRGAPGYVNFLVRVSAGFSMTRLSCGSLCLFLRSASYWGLLAASRASFACSSRSLDASLLA